MYSLLSFQPLYLFANLGVLFDVLKLIYSYLNHSKIIYSITKYCSVKCFLRALIPTFYMLLPATFNTTYGPTEASIGDRLRDEQGDK
jgi:hypothetical protein